MSCLMMLAIKPGAACAQRVKEVTDMSPSLQVHYELFASGQAESGLPEAPDILRFLTGYEKIYIRNTGTAPVKQIKIRVYPNSYSSDSTALSEQLLRARDLRLYFADTGQLGSIKELNFTAKGQALVKEDLSGTGENITLTLPAPLAPGDFVTLQTPFLLQLPARLIDIGYIEKERVSYLKDWFPQVENSVVIPTAKNNLILHLTISEGMQCSIGGVLQKAATLDSSGFNVFRLEMGTHATIAVNTGRSPSEKPSRFTAAEQPAADFFKKLLPGPLAKKRPARPDSLFAQMAAARHGALMNVHKPVKPAFLFNFKEADAKRYLSFGPAIGYNDYDKWMPGILVHNYGLPVSKFNFLIAPLYSTEDHTISGIGHLSFTDRRLSDAWQISLDGSSYAFNRFNSWSDAAGILHKGRTMRLLRIVPAVRYKWYPDERNRGKVWKMAAKSYILRRDSWVLENDDLVMDKTTTAIGEIKAAVMDNRVLYPYYLQLQLQGTDQFLRAGLTGKYFLNYDAKGNGLQLRGFAGKFFYLKQKNALRSFNLRDYFFNLSGATGAQDFTYSDYYIGRSAFEGWMSQQMAVSDGFFKVSTPYLQDPLGQTDDWLAAVNLTTDLPEGLNPFAVLPFRLPVRVFADFGTYGELWSENPTAGRFLYDAGVQVSVLKEAVTIYLPLVYSKVYGDYYKSIGDMGGFAQRIRFSISLANLLPKGLNKDIQW